MILNPFVEGFLMLVLGVGCLVGAAFLHSADLTTAGNTIIGVAIGYSGHAALVQPPPAK